MTATFLPYTTDLIQALGWAILHSLWQALLVFICLRIVLRLWPAATASVKYNLSFFSLAGIFGWFLVTLYEQLAAVKHLHAAAAQQVAGQMPPLSLHMPAVYQSQQELTWMFPNLEICFPILVGLYVAGVGVMCIKLVADLAQLQQIRKKMVLPIDAAWERYLHKLAQQLQIPRKVKLLISQHIQVPVMIGFLKPVILLPIAMFNNLGAQQLEAILLHELAHIKRNDYILNIFQSIVETTLFFNPFVWWISKYIRLEREHCCDDIVIAHTAQPLHYAKALVILEEYRFTTNPMAMAAADNKQHLFYRIKRIMEMKTTHLNYSQKLMAMLIIAIGLTAIAWITPSAKLDNKAIAADLSTVITPGVQEVAQQPADTVPSKTNKAPIQNSSDKQNDDSATDDAKDKDQSTDQAKDQSADESREHREMKRTAEERHAAHQNMKMAHEAAQKAVHDAMKDIDWKAINAQTREALKAVDWKKINKEVESSLKAIDWKKINAEVNDAVKESRQSVDPEMIRKSVELGLKSAQTAMASIDIENIIKQSMMHAGMTTSDREAMRKDLEKAKAEQREALREVREKMQEVNKNTRDAQRGALAAKRDAERAKATHNQYKELIQKMADDKLIDPAQSFSIEKKNDQLYINGAQQPAAVADKYRKYLNARNITIKGGKDNLDVNAKD